MLHSAPLHTLIEGYSSSKLAINKTEPFLTVFFMPMYFHRKEKKSDVVHIIKEHFLGEFTFTLGKRKLYIT